MVMSQSTLSRFAAGDRGLSMEALDRLFDALHLEIKPRKPKAKRAAICGQGICSRPSGITRWSETSSSSSRQSPPGQPDVTETTEPVKADILELDQHRLVVVRLVELGGSKSDSSGRIRRRPPSARSR
jgi:hypothetical protein